MPQGNFKRKAKVPDSIKKKQKSKGHAFTRRSNAPVQPKKNKFTEQQKIKQVISKTVNKLSEDDLRSLATEGNLNLSKAQKAVAEHHKVASGADSTTTAC